MFSLQTKRALYLTKTPVQVKCKLHDNLMLYTCESDGNVFRNLMFVMYFAMKQKFYKPLFGDQIFSFGD